MKKPPPTKSELIAKINNILFDVKAASRELTQLLINHHFADDHPEMCEQANEVDKALDVAEDELRALLQLVESSLIETPTEKLP
jgi:hypothetical protein